MNLASRVLISFFVLIAVLLTCTSLSRERLFDLCTYTDQFGNRISLFEVLRNSEQLNREVRSTIEFTCSKGQIVEDLLSGERTLIETAIRFRALYEDARNWHDPDRPRPAPEDGESWCREVIEWAVAKTWHEQSPSQAEALRQRLEEELQDYLEYRSVATLAD
jgi:hypothetical protein